MKSRPETIAIRSVNQYRRRDVFGYFGLRLYLDAVCSRRDRWATEVATDLLQHRSDPSYLCSYHHKETGDDGKPVYRPMHIPGPNEAIAEAALLAHCADTRGALGPEDCVYSYHLARKDERRGLFVPYFEGFSKRHRSIAEACRRHPNGLVVYTDFRKFYPSISTSVAGKAWDAAADVSGLSGWARKLGQKILDDHGKASEQGSILTGPMFSHLVANLVLVEIDQAMDEELPGRYFRYVDDVVLVGDEGEVRLAEKLLTELVGELGIDMNEGKRFELSTAEWLQGEDDFGGEDHTPSWKTVIGGVKHLLVLKPYALERFRQLFAGNGIRLSPLDYSSVARERGYMLRMLEYVRTGWFGTLFGEATPESIVNDALVLRARYTAELRELLSDAGDLSGYQRKRRIHKLRYYAGRLAYLADPDDLGWVAQELRSMPEMAQFSAIFRALDRADASDLLMYGVSGAQAAAQPLRALGQPITCRPENWGEPHRQARAALLLNGVELHEEHPPRPHSELNRLCSWSTVDRELFQAKDPFVRELACLHGISEPRHKDLMLSAFDPDESLALEMEELARPYS